MSEVKETIAQEAKRILEAIPANKWMINEFVSKDGTKSCALGWYGRIKYSELEEIAGEYHEPYKYWEYNSMFWSKTVELRKATQNYIKKYIGTWGDIAIVNNYDGSSRPINGYTEKEIKDRVIHLLDDMIKEGY